ncbi:MAG: hypothetical protein KAY09_03485 [Nitrospira sp.]|nr:hypothetical protein [Nitrospira sp.]
MGRWTAKDPLKFAGTDSNLFEYVGNSPITWFDSSGLTKKDRKYGFPDDFWNWYHKQEKRKRGGPDIDDREEAKDYYEEWKRQGKPNPEGHRTEPKRSQEPFGFCPVDDPAPAQLPPIVFLPAPDDELPPYVRPFTEDLTSPRAPRIPGGMRVPPLRPVFPIP